jgi:hypothetical protein
MVVEYVPRPRRRRGSVWRPRAKSAPRSARGWSAAPSRWTPIHEPATPVHHIRSVRAPMAQSPTVTVHSAAPTLSTLGKAGAGCAHHPAVARMIHCMRCESAQPVATSARAPHHHRSLDHLRRCARGSEPATCWTVRRRVWVGCREHIGGSIGDPQVGREERHLQQACARSRAARATRTVMATGRRAYRRFGVRV